MATSVALQAHYDEISSQMQVLPLAAAPKGFAQLDLVSLTEGSASAAKVTYLLSKAAAGLHQCQICGSASSSSRLGFLLSTKLDFTSRSVQIAAGQFACEVCRAVSSPALLLQLSTPVPQSEDFTRADQLKELFLHFAAVNSAPAHITANTEALSLWVQELACRAYSMGVVASSLKGWSLMGPDGQEIKPGAAGAAVNLLQQLLSQPSCAAATAAADGKAQSVKKHKQEQHAADVQMQPGKRKSVSSVDPGSSKKKVKKQAAEKGAAAAAAAAAPDQQPAKTPKQQGTTPKQHEGHKTPQQVATTPQQQQQQQQAAKPKPAKQQAGSTLLASTQQQQDLGSSAVKKTTQPSGQAAAAAVGFTPSKNKKRAMAPGGAAAKQAAHFKTPQVVKSKKAAKSAKRRLSDPS